MKDTRRRKKGIAAALFLALMTVNGIVPVHAEEVQNSWDETKRVHYLRRPVSTAISVYTKGENDDITHEEGVLDGVTYDILRVNPTENTLVQVDYSATPAHINSMVDGYRLEQGYHFAGSINAGYFENGGGGNYGKPVGAVRRYNEWAWWNGEPCTPAYGSGFATAYIDGDNLKLRYHGWSGGGWCCDAGWAWWTGYTIDGGAFGVSGSFTYYANGVQQDITGGSSGGINYRAFGRAVTILAQKSDLQFLLITIYGTVAEDRIRYFLGELGAYDAIRFDGGGSTQMVYETEYVRNVPPELEWTEMPMANEEETDEETLGYLIVQADRIPVYEEAKAGDEEQGEATIGERYQVFEEKKEEESTWYRIGEKRWIETKEGDVEFFDNDEIQEARERDMDPFQIRVNARNTEVHTSPDASSAMVGTLNEGSVYTVYEEAKDAVYSWYRIGKKRWIPALPGWVEALEGTTAAVGEIQETESVKEAEMETEPEPVQEETAILPEPVLGEEIAATGQEEEVY